MSVDTPTCAGCLIRDSQIAALKVLVDAMSSTGTDRRQIIELNRQIADLTNRNESLRAQAGRLTEMLDDPE